MKKARLHCIGLTLGLTGLALIGLLAALQATGRVAAQALPGPLFSIASGGMSVTQALSPAAALSPEALVVDDLDTGFVRYGEQAYWHEATSPPDPAGWYYNGQE